MALKSDPVAPGVNHEIHEAHENGHSVSERPTQIQRGDLARKARLCHKLPRLTMRLRYHSASFAAGNPNRQVEALGRATTTQDNVFHDNLRQHYLERGAGNTPAGSLSLARLCADESNRIRNAFFFIVIMH